MCIPLWFGFGPHSEDGYGLSPSKSPSKVGAVAMVVMFLGWIVELVAITTIYWAVFTWLTVDTAQRRITITEAHGLWKYCSKFIGLFVRCEHSPGWLVAVRALNVIGMMFGSGALVFMGLFTFLHSEKWNKIFKSSALSSAIFSGVLILIGAIVYGASVSQGKAPLPHKPVGDVQYVLSWSFALSIIAAILFVISGVIMGFARKPRMIE
ncbi:voltage-dependent calcium channel gamma-1 subunit-like [Mytilus edulis]|uniref:Uncharacterized protein n=2 Tax=Mytilus TaxID=6548 RepID=A0A8B6GZX2_MYTGA|nr:Hypothetical predicted protein [Mytilus galloprovincialis]